MRPNRSGMVPRGPQIILGHLSSVEAAAATVEYMCRCICQFVPVVTMSVVCFFSQPREVL